MTKELNLKLVTDRERERKELWNNNHKFAFYTDKFEISFNIVNTNSKKHLSKLNKPAFPKLTQNLKTTHNKIQNLAKQLTNDESLTTDISFYRPLIKTLCLSTELIPNSALKIPLNTDLKTLPYFDELKTSQAHLLAMSDDNSVIGTFASFTKDGYENNNFELLILNTGEGFYIIMTTSNHVFKIQNGTFALVQNTKKYTDEYHENKDRIKDFIAKCEMLMAQKKNQQ